MKPVSGKTNAFVNNIIVPKTHSLISLDVVCMFDSIALDIALDCVEKKLNLNHNLTKVSKKEIIIATRTVFNNMVFSFNNKFYKNCLFSNFSLMTRVALRLSHSLLNNVSALLALFFSINFFLILYRTRAFPIINTIVNYC